MDDSKPISNEKQIEASIEAPRQLPPNKRTNQQFKALIRDANESSLIDDMAPIFFERHDGTDYRRALYEEFSNYPTGLGFNNNLPPARPDWLEGPAESTFGQSIEESLRGYALPCPARICLPHVTGAFGEMHAAFAQVTYTGACLVEARRQALARMERADPAGHAAVLSFATDGRLIVFLAHNARKEEYYMNEVGRMEITGNTKYFKIARRQVRNMQDLGRRTAEKLRDDLVEFYRAKGGKQGSGRRDRGRDRGRSRGKGAAAKEGAQDGVAQGKRKQKQRERRKSRQRGMGKFAALDEAGHPHFRTQKSLFGIKRPPVWQTPRLHAVVL